MFWMKVKLIQGAAGVKNVFTQIQLVCQLYPFLALYDLDTIIYLLCLEWTTAMHYTWGDP